MRSPEVDAYIAALPPLRQERLSQLRDAAHRAVPGLAESIEWAMPTFRKGGRWFGMSSRAAYTALYLSEPERIARVIAAEPRIKHGKACLNIGDKVPLPIAVLEAEIRDVFEDR